MTYYQESQTIFSKIRRSKKILVNCHNYPDPDSIGSALALRQILLNMGKQVDVICPTSKLPSNLSFLKGYEKINIGVNFNSFDFSKYDLVIFIDSANLKIVTGVDTSTDLSKINDLIVIDHHLGNDLVSTTKLIDIKASSVGEMIFKLFTDNQIQIDPIISTSLLTAIYGDTWILTLPSASEDTYEVINKLIHNGADRNRVVMSLAKSESVKMFKFWKIILDKIQIDQENRFAYAFIPNNEYHDFADVEEAKSKAASIFSNGLIDTDFGMIGIETRVGKLNVSFRARTDFDTSKISRSLGGGGHKEMSAVIIEGLTFEEAVEKVLSVCRKYANKKV